MASYYGTTSPNGANDGDDWINSSTGERRVFHAGTNTWVPLAVPTVSGAFGASGVVTAASAVAATAGGAAGLALGSGAAGVLGIYFGSGVPTLSVPKGSLYLRTDGSSTSTRAYIATDAVGTWTALTTAA